MMNAIEQLFERYMTNPDADSLMLLNKKGDYVAVFHLHAVKPEEVKLSVINLDEKYMLYYQGLTIYFSSWKEI